MSELWGLAIVLLAIFCTVQALFILSLARAIGLLQLRLGPDPGPLQTAAGLDIGAKAPVLTGIDLRTDEPRGLDMHGGRWCALFISVTCSVCRTLARDVAAVGRDRSLGAMVVLVVRASVEQAQIFASLPKEVIVFVDPNGDMHDRYGVEEVPYAFLISEGHVLAKGVVNTRDQLEMLAEGRTRKAQEPAWVRVSEKESHPLEDVRHAQS